MGPDCALHYCRESPEQKAVEAALAEAMKTQPTLGNADRTMPAAAKACEPDFSVCPSETEKQGAVCIATAVYVGACAADMQVLSMTANQAFAFARVCNVSFPCVGAAGGSSFLSLPVGYMDLRAEAGAESGLASPIRSCGRRVCVLLRGSSWRRSPLRDLCAPSPYGSVSHMLLLHS